MNTFDNGIVSIFEGQTSLKKSQMKSIAIATCCLLFVAGKAFCQQHPLIHIERQWVEAIQHRDTIFLNQLLSDDFTDITWKGDIRHKAAMLHFSDSPASSQTLSGLKERIYGNTGIVNGLNTIILKGMQNPVRIRFTDVFIKTAGKWHAVSAQESLVQ